jgi:hypothetical protein
MLGRRTPQLSLSDTDEWWKRILPHVPVGPGSAVEPRALVR